MKHVQGRAWGLGGWDEGRSCLVLEGSRLRVQRELGQGLETLPWEGFMGKGLGRTHRVWGGRRGGVCCPANTRGGLGGCAGRCGTWAWGWVFGQHQAWGGEAGRRGLLHATRQLAKRTHFVERVPSPSPALQPPARVQRQPARTGVAVCRAGAEGPGQLDHWDDVATPAS